MFLRSWNYLSQSPHVKKATLVGVWLMFYLQVLFTSFIYKFYLQVLFTSFIYTMQIVILFFPSSIAAINASTAKSSGTENVASSFSSHSSSSLSES